MSSTCCFYVPVAPLGAGLGWPLPASLAAGAVLSLTAEGSQLFSVERDPDGNDVLANMLGTALGAIVLLRSRRRPNVGRRAELLKNRQFDSMD